MSTRSYYLLVDGRRQGPLPAEGLASAGLRWDSLVWFKGCRDWLSARDVPELVALFDEPPPVPLNGALPAASPSASKPVPPLAVPAHAVAAGRPERAQAFAPPTEGEPSTARLTLPRVPYDNVSMRRTYRTAMGLYLSGLGLLVACGLLAYAAGLTDFFDHTARYNPAVRNVEFPPNRGIELLQIVFIIAAIASGVIGLILLIAGTAVSLVFLFRCWIVIQDGRARATPGQAVGLLFVPFFNLYWVFVALRGLAIDLNRFAVRYELDVPRASPLLGLACGIYFVTLLIPWLDLATLVLLLFLFPLFLKSVARPAIELCTERNRDLLDETPPAPEDFVGYELRRSSPTAGQVTLRVIAACLAPFAAGLLVIGALASGAMACAYVEREVRAQAFAAGLADLAPLANGPDQTLRQRVNQFRQEVDSWHRFGSRNRMTDVWIFLGVTAGGAVLSGVVAALLLIARTLHRPATGPEPAPAT